MFKVERALYMSSTKRRHIAIIGAGPGGLTSAMILARHGFEVSVFEKNGVVGGRNAPLRLGDFSFDVGPTFLMMKGILDAAFEEAGADSARHLEFQRLTPMYRLQFADRILEPTSDHAAMAANIEAAFPGKGALLDAFLKREKVRFEHLYPCLQKPYGTLGSLFSPDLIRAIPHLAANRSLFDLLYHYFGDEKLALAFTFQSKYLGMSPWECPGLFAILSYIEHAYGVYHTTGGLCRISQAMADVAVGHGAKLYLNTPVARIETANRVAKGILLESGDVVEADEIIINADFGHAMQSLFAPGFLRRYAPAKVAKKRFSCSTFMLYLGLDKLYADVPHHTIVFANEYRRNVDEVFRHQKLSTDISFYVRNASVTDETLAPPGKSGIYVLVPVPNLRGNIDWAQEHDPFRELVLEQISRRTSMTDIRQHIECEQSIAPPDWRDDYGVYAGATFNLAHNMTQMIYLRPHNKFEECDRCWLVGGGTHPGSGLPTIYESGRIAARMIAEKHGVSYQAAPRKLT